MRQRWSRLLLILCVCLAWALISSHPIWRYLSHAKAAAVTAVGLSSIALGVVWLDRLNRRPHQIGIGWFLALFLVLTTAFAVVYPKSLKQPVNGRSDREDALRVELIAVRHHQNPFEARTFLHNPPTPLPGAMLLAAPFFAIGHIAWQNFLWYGLFFLFAIRFFRYRATALFFLTLFLLLSPANLSDFTSGGDYLTNFFYVAIGLSLFVVCLDRPFYLSLLAALFLGVTLSSRAVYVLALIPLLAYTVQRTSRARALGLFTVILFALAVVTLGMLGPHPVAKLLEELNQTSAGKLHLIPGALCPRWTLPLFAAMLASIAFFVRVDLPRLFLFLSAANFVMLAPFVFTFAAHGLWQRLSYLAVFCLPFVLWALARYEHTSSATLTPMRPALRSR
jgi:Cytochrome b(C-terminal)/b6/petD